MKKILFVDDEPHVLAGIQRQLRKQFPLEIALGPVEGLAILQRWPEFAVVVADMRMPEMSGVEFLAEVRNLAPDIIRIMLTGNVEQQTASQAINAVNVFRFLNKPCSSECLVESLTAALRQHDLITAERELLEKTLHGSIQVLTQILALTEPKTFGQGEQLRTLIRQLAEAMKLQPLWHFEVAAMLADIGCVMIPPEVALKARAGQPFAPAERQMFQRIPTVGGELLSHIPRLEEIARIVTYQRKNYDGSGEPEDFIAGEMIPAGARMLRILRDLLQLEARGNSRAAAFEQLRGRRGHYDPGILETAAVCLLPLAKPLPAPAQPIAVSFPSLRAGHVLHADLETREGMLLVAAGTRLNATIIQRLANFATLSRLKEPIQIMPD